MLIRSQTTTLLQISCELLLCSQVIFKSMKVADVRFWWSSKCEWVKKVFGYHPKIITIENSLYKFLPVMSKKEVFRQAGRVLAKSLKAS